MSDATGASGRFQRRPWLGWLTVFVVLVLVAELVLRLIAPDPIRFAFEFRQIYRYHPQWYTDFEPDTSTVVRLGGGDGGFFQNFLMTINAHGFRDWDRAIDHPRSTRSAITRVHAIGDSFTMGWGVNFESSYPVMLEGLLGDGYEVVNLGLNGFGAVGASGKSRTVAKAFPADLVVYLASDNDYADDEHAANHAARPAIIHWALDGVNWLRRHSYLAATPWALRWWLYFRASVNQEIEPRVVEISPGIAALDDDAPPDPHLGGVTKAAISEYAQELAAHDVAFVVIAHGDGAVARDIYRYCRQAGINAHLIDVAPRLKLAGEGHFNREGNRAVAEFVATTVPTPFTR